MKPDEIDEIVDVPINLYRLKKALKKRSALGLIPIDEALNLVKANIMEQRYKQVSEIMEPFYQEIGGDCVVTRSRNIAPLREGDTKYGGSKPGPSTSKPKINPPGQGKKK